MGRLVITIARGYGSGGRTMGRLLAEELGISFYDRELIRLASDKSGISEAMFGEADERVKTSPFFPRLKRTYQGAVQILLPKKIYSIFRQKLLKNWQKRKTVLL